MKNKDNLDVIRVWFCSDCKSYYIYFGVNKLYCEKCGRKCEKRIYMEFKNENKI